MKSNIMTEEGDCNNSLERTHWDTSHDNFTKAILERDAAVFIHQSLSTPCLDAISGSNGSHLETLDGRELLDFHGNSVHQGGFANPYVMRHVSEAMNKMPFCSRRFTNEYAVECAESLVRRAPESLTRVLFAPSGSIVNGIALKIARIVTGRHKVVSFWGSFHGAGLDTIAIGGENQFKKGMGPMMSGCLQIPPPGPDGPFGSEADELAYADYLEYVADHEGDIGAFIAEPIRSTTVRIPSPKYWKRIREICDRHGILLIFDEIPTALYRTGSFFAFDKFGVEPDIVTIGKGLGGGLIPFAAVLANERCNCAADISLGHYTHEKSPIGAAACLGLLEWFDSIDIEKRVKEINQRFTNIILRISENPSVKDIRSIGALFAIEMNRSDDAERLMYWSLRHGLSFKVSEGKVLTLAPPLSITDTDLDKAGEIIINGINGI